MFSGISLAAPDELTQERLINENKPDFSRYISTLAEDHWNEGVTSSVNNFLTDTGQDMVYPKLSVEELSKYKFEGKSFIDRPMSDATAQDILDRKEQHARLQEIINRGAEGRGGTSFVTGLGVGILDSIPGMALSLAAAAALPETGALGAIGAGLKLAGGSGGADAILGKNALSSVGGHIAAGAIEGGAQATAAQGVVALQKSREYQDMSAAEFMYGVGGGIVGGAGVGSVVGGWKAWRGTLPVKVKTDMLKVAKVQMEETGVVDIQTHIDNHPAVIAAQLEKNKLLNDIGELSDQEKIDALTHAVYMEKVDTHLPEIVNEINSVNKDIKGGELSKPVDQVLSELELNKKDGNLAHPDFLPPTNSNLSGKKVTFDGKDGIIFKNTEGDYVFRSEGSNDIIINKDPNSNLRELGFKYKKEASSFKVKDNKVTINGEEFSISKDSWKYENGKLSSVELLDSKGESLSIDSPHTLANLRRAFLKDELNTLNEHNVAIHDAFSQISNKTNEVLDSLDLLRSPEGTNKGIRSTILKSLDNETLKLAEADLRNAAEKLKAIHPEQSNSLSEMADNLKKIQDVKDFHSEYRQALREEAHAEVLKRNAQLASQKIKELNAFKEKPEPSIPKDQATPTKAEVEVKTPASEAVKPKNSLKEEMIAKEKLAEQKIKENELLLKDEKHSDLAESIANNIKEIPKHEKGLIAAVTCVLGHLI